MLKRLKGLKRVTPGERQAGPSRRSHWCGLGVAFACAVGSSETLLQSFKGFLGFRGFKGFKRLRAGKRQAWTPIRSHWCGLGCLLAAGLGMPKRWGPGKRQAWKLIRSDWCGVGVPVGCRIRHAKSMLKRLKGLKRVTPGEPQAGCPRRSDGCGLGVAFACAVGRFAEF